MAKLLGTLVLLLIAGVGPFTALTLTLPNRPDTGTIPRPLRHQGTL